MNWGNAIIIVFVSFAALIATLVYKSSITKIDLVSKDYYEQELNYQHQIDGRQNMAETKDKTRVNLTADSVLIRIPSLGIPVSGRLWWYYPSDAARDVKMSFQTDPEGNFGISRKIIPAGRAQLKISWERNGVKFEDEQQVSVY